MDAVLFLGTGLHAEPRGTDDRAASGALRHGIEQAGGVVSQFGRRLPQSEITVAEVLKGAGYKTAMVGKWHMGHLPKHLPITQGFDSYYGIPYSNDMDRDPSVKGNWVTTGKTSPWSVYRVPLLRNAEEIERPVNQTTITRRYTQEAVKFIKDNKEKPFFLYLAHSMPHIPLYRSKKFEGKSLNGIYGDVISEIDWSVGQVLNTLRRQKLDKKTIVLFTSDNGPWEVFKTHGGSAGLLRGAKGGTREGGMREPAIFWGPGNVKPGVVQEMGSTLDVLPTFASLWPGPRHRRTVRSTAMT